MPLAWEQKSVGEYASSLPLRLKFYGKFYSVSFDFECESRLHFFFS